MGPNLQRPSAEEQLVGITTVELLEEVDRRLSEALFNPHREGTASVNEELEPQVEFHFLATLGDVRDAVHNYNRGRAYQNDRQRTSDFDKEVHIGP